MKTAILTGASSGMGLEFARQLKVVFPEIESLWLIARRKDKLEEAAKELNGLHVEILPMDLCSLADLEKLGEKLREEKPDVALLINNAGCGYMGFTGEGDVAEHIRMTDLNVRALTVVTHMVLPYMSKGGRVLNSSSIASFCPNGRMNTYSASKAYVTSFTRCLAFELKGKGITATAICPGPMETEFLDAGKIRGKSKDFDSLPRCNPQKTALLALKAARAGKVICTPTAFYKLYRVLAKVLPHALVVHLAKCY